MKTKNIENQFDEIISNKPDIEYYFDKKKLGYKDKRIIELLSKFGVKGKKVLDIGPGTGRWLKFMHSREAEFLGAIDISQEALNRGGFYM